MTRALEPLDRSGDELVKVGRRVLEMEAEAVRALAERLDARFAAAVALVAECRGRVVVTGMGKSGLIGRKLAATLAATGTPALFLHAAEAVHGDLGMLARGDLVVALSKSGEIVLDVSVGEEACPMNLTPTSSAAAMLALGDALAVAVLTRRGIGPDDFAQLHPGGSLGRRLVRVDELMHVGDEVPRVPADATLIEVIREMTRKRLGATAVVDQGGRLVGIVTDGDLRRAMERGEGRMPVTAAELMTRAPKAVGRGELAATALALMERHAITQLLILDDGGRPDGILHLHDLLRVTIA